MANINKQKRDHIMAELGHPDNLSGTTYIRTALDLYEPGMAMTKELYPGIARAHSTTASRVERSMRHSIETAWSRGLPMDHLKWFGCTVDPNKGSPTVSEYVARMARLCREEIEI